jgi:hypothetical protein
VKFGHAIGFTVFGDLQHFVCKGTHGINGPSMLGAAQGSVFRIVVFEGTFRPDLVRSMVKLTFTTDTASQKF